MSSTIGGKSGEADAPPEVPARGWRARYTGLSRRYGRARRWAPILTFIAGFVWDSVTLTRIDRMTDNLILLAYLAALALLIAVTLRGRAEGSRIARVRWLWRTEPHFQWAIQFLLGGLLSSYVVFYFKSASWTQTSVFLLLLVVLLVGNEFLQDRLGNAKLLALLFFFCLFSFLTFFIPIVVAYVGTPAVLFSGAASLAVTLWLFALALDWRREGWRRRFAPVALAVIAAYVSLHVLYFANLIPPVPLALKEAGIFHRVARTSDGYRVEQVPAPWYRYWKRWEDPFLLAPGEAVYCYSAVFAPRRIRVPVLHRWRRRDPARGWVDTDGIQFEISGGREGGFRGFTAKRSVTPGRWRVEIETTGGSTLGRIDFTIVAAPEGHPPLVQRVIP